MNILAVDPGETTGLAWCDSLWLDEKIDDRFGKAVGLGQIDGPVPEQVWKIFRGTERLGARITVSESSDHFLLKGGKSLTKHALVPIKMSGAIAFMTFAKDHQAARFNSQLFEEQTPSIKSIITDEVLKAYGFKWVKTRERHQADAARHLVQFIRRYKEGKRKNSPLYLRVQEVLGS